MKTELGGNTTRAGDIRMNLLDWIKENVKEGADIEEVKKYIDEIQDPLKNITTVENAVAFIKRNSIFKRAFDSEVSKAVATHDERFKNEKLPGILDSEREKIRKELNPEETPEQKRIRELEEKLSKQDAMAKLEKAKTELRKKAQEIGADPIKAERYAAFGEDALKWLEQDHAEAQTYIQTKIDEGKKEFLKGRPPAGGKSPQSTREQLEADYAQAQEERNVAKMMVIKNQLARLPQEE